MTKSRDVSDLICRSGEAIDISIPLRFNGPQPNAYGVGRAASEPVRAGSLTGDTRQGGSVNFEQYTFIPHCNGTHTECVGHITDERISVRDCLRDVMVPALLVTVEPERDGNDLVISKTSIELSIEERDVRGSALIVRTLPNDDQKLMAEYDQNAVPPYFTTEAMEYIVERGFSHLLADLPSIDRLFDDGKLSNHRIFWSVKAGSRIVEEDTRIHSTITELIYVHDRVGDGEYLLNIQIAPFESDCAPSRPILISGT